jgi:hypothetical protein
MFEPKIDSSVRSDVKATVVILIVWLLLGRVALRGVDYHHQGLVFSEALRLLNGQTLYRDVFSQYGPVPAYMQAMSLMLFGKQISSLVILSLALHFASSVMMFLLWRRVYSTYVAVSGITLWLGTSYFLRMDYPFFPWWGDFVLFFSCLVMSTIYLLENMEKRDKHRFLTTVVLGFSLLGILLTRYHLGLLVILFLGIYYWKQKKASHFFWEALCLAATTALVVVFIAVKTNVFGPAVYQTIVWPYQWLNGVRPGSPPVDRVIYAIVSLGLTPLVIILLGIFLVADIQNRKLQSKTLISALLLLVLYRFKLMVNTNYWPPPTGPLMLGQLNQEGVLWALLALLIVLTVRKFPKDLKMEAIRREWPANELIGVVVLLGIYPVPDHAHLWMSVLPIIGPTIAITRKFSNTNRLPRFAVAVVCVWVALLGIANATQKLQSSKYVQSNNSYTRGMYESIQSNAVRSPIMKALSMLQVDNPEQKFLNYCQDTVYDSFGAQDKGPDPYNFLWGPGANGVYLPSEVFGVNRKRYIQMEKPILITCGADKGIDEKIIELDYEKYIDSQTEGVDDLGGQLSIRVFKPIVSNKNQFNFNE